MQSHTPQLPHPILLYFSLPYYTLSHHVLKSLAFLVLLCPVSTFTVLTTLYVSNTVHNPVYLLEIVHQYHGTFEFVSMRTELLSPLTGLIAALPGAVTGSSRPPGLLRLLSAFVRYDETVAVIVPPLPIPAPTPALPSTTATTAGGGSVVKGKEKGKEKGKKSKAVVKSALVAPLAAHVPVEDGTDLIVQTLIRCVAARADFEVSRMVMDVLSVLLEREEGRAILPHAHLIIQCFSKRFVGPDFDDSPGVSAQLKLSEMKITPTGSVKQGMREYGRRVCDVMLCTVSDVM